ncbi:MAG TPA: hypothetical protein VFB62_04075 [Polyangiaceae bacterium]|jgi:hypothetical protein|nr:hypothetical protein [Polyangiaceae bacterium]
MSDDEDVREPRDGGGLGLGSEDGDGGAEAGDGALATGEALFRLGGSFGFGNEGVWLDRPDGGDGGARPPRSV